MQQFSGPFSSEQMVNAWAPGARMGVSRYLRPGFDFRTDFFASPTAPYPFLSGPDKSPYLAFQYTLAIKLNNAIFLRENSRFAPYLMLGAGGSYQFQQPDAFAPLGLGVQFRTGSNGALRLEASRQLSFNGSPQPVSLSLMYSWSPSPQAIPLQDTLIPSIPPAQEPVLAQAIEPEDAKADVEATVLAPPALFADPAQEELTPESEVFAQELIAVAQADEETEEGLIGDSEELAASWLEEEEADMESDLVEVLEEDLELVLSAEEEMEDHSLFPDPSLPLEGESGEDVQSFADFPEPELVENPALPVDASGLAASECGGLALPAIMFEARSTSLGEMDKVALREVAEAMKACPELILVLEGYANENGNADDNLVLAVKRAFRVKYFLVYEHHISQRRILSSGKGPASAGQPPRQVKLSWQYIPLPQTQPVN